MKTLAITLALALSSFICNAQKNDTLATYTITVKINNTLNNNGHMLIGLHTTDTFMKTKGIQNSKAEIKDGKVEVTFKDVVPGEYAVMVLHDENDNNRMDFESNGMPKESYGISNNPMLFGPPTFSDAAFKVTNENIDMIIRL
ncbi:DUF2141 domain-containing protein [Corallibacter vietnamensis]|uniref:DUF2141 domain-containing protein n=1 Tax=Corallibacter vietnamensis TaxID=904130 RepID=A0ABP7H3R0_9FLAO